MAYNGVIETASGDLLRCGFTTFTAGPGESLRSDVPFPGQVKYKSYPDGNMHNWNGSSWDLITNPGPQSPSEYATEHKAIAYSNSFNMGTLIKDYTFDASAKTITFDSFSTIEKERILVVTNTTDGIIIYNAWDSGTGGTVSTNVLTVTYDTTTMADTDNLNVMYEMPSLLTNIDEASETVSYIGKAQAGTATSTADWQIQKLDTSSGTVVTWADGNDRFDNIWDNRASLSYS